ncbi:MAG: hypothetical protein JW384_03037 [Nitrosomonadaceae bacterium]|nr:hypothetical protein [Nitrosomonadaceae bacterium]
MDLISDAIIVAHKVPWDHLLQRTLSFEGQRSISRSRRGGDLRDPRIAIGIPGPYDVDNIASYENRINPRGTFGCHGALRGDIIYFFAIFWWYIIVCWYIAPGITGIVRCGKSYPCRIAIDRPRHDLH